MGPFALTGNHGGSYAHPAVDSGSFTGRRYPYLGQSWDGERSERRRESRERRKRRGRRDRKRRRRRTRKRRRKASLKPPVEETPFLTSLDLLGLP